MNKNILFRTLADYFSAKAGRIGKIKISAIGNPRETKNKNIAKIYKKIIHEYILDDNRFGCCANFITFEDEGETIYGDISYACNLEIWINDWNEVLKYYRLKRELKNILNKRDGFFIYSIEWTF